MLPLLSQSLSLGLTLLYLFWQLQNLYYWRKITQAQADFSPQTAADFPASVTIVPARNEAENLGPLLNDLTIQSATTPDDRVVVVDDDSIDASIEIVSKADKADLLELSHYLAGREVIAHKKAALTYAIESSTQPLIVTTDADCRRPPEVLSSIKQAAADGYAMICGPVFIDRVDNNCAGFQALDLAAYMLLTAAYQARQKPLLANGAHLSFSRDLFEKIGGYTGVDHLPSGDDVLLLQKAMQAGYRNKITFLTQPEALVTTRAVAGWYALWQQRLRWAGKTKAYTDPLLTYIQVLNYLLALSIVAGLLLGFWWPEILIGSLFAWGVKTVIDYVLLRDVCQYFRRSELMKYYAFSQLVQPFYLVLIGTAALLGVKTDWKGRRVK